MSRKHNRWSFQFDPRPHLCFYHQKNAVKGSGPPQSVVFWSDPETHPGGELRYIFTSALITWGDPSGCVKTRWKQSLTLWRSSSSHQELLLTKTQPAWRNFVSASSGLFWLPGFQTMGHVLLTQVTRSVCENNPAVQNEGMSFSHQPSCLSNWNGSGSWILPHFPVQRRDDRKARLKRSYGSLRKCQRVESQTEKVPLREPDRQAMDWGLRQKKEKRKERGGGWPVGEIHGKQEKQQHDRNQMCRPLQYTKRRKQRREGRGAGWC